MEYIQHIQALIEEQAVLGVDKGEVVSKYGHIPQLAPEAYNIYMFSPLTDEQLAPLERVLNQEVPKQYKIFLTLFSNGMHIFHRCLNLFGLQEGLDRRGRFQGPFDLSIPNVYERPSNADSNCFFLGSYSYDGSLLYLKDDASTVYYCARRDATPIKEWTSFSDMLIEEIQRLKSLHNADGILKSTRRSTLPIP